MDKDDRAWDAIVVGSGLGGLTCAAYLAASGLRVLVLEQHDVAGGNGHVFRRRRAYEFDVGVHYLGDCGPGGVIPSILDSLGLGGRVAFRPMDPDGFDHLILPGVTFDVPAGWDRYRRRVVETFPTEAAGLSRFFDICHAIVEQRSRQASAVATPTSDELSAVAWRRRSLADLFVHCDLSAPARTVLAAQSGNYGISPTGVTVGQHLSMIDHYMQGAYYPEGGGQVLAATLVEAIESRGGELRTRCAVRRIDVRDGRAVGVTAADGRHIAAPIVVSNADYRRTVLELIGGEPAGFTAGVLDRAQRSVPALGLAVLYVALDRELPYRRNANIWWFRDNDIEAMYDRVEQDRADEVEMLFASFASIKDPHSRAVCPPGHANFQLMTLCPPGYARWGVESGPASGIRYRRTEAYQREKRRLTDSMLAVAESILGDFRQHITHLEAATPLSQERFTWSTGGTPYGLRRWGSSRGARPGNRTTIDGLFVVGQGTRHGGGIGGVMLGGTMCAGEILDRPLFAEVRDGAAFGDARVLPERPAGWDPLAVSRGTARRDAPGLARIG